MEYEELKKLMSELKKPEMTELERVAAYNRGEEVDFIPYAMGGPDMVFAEILGYKTSQYAKNMEIKKEVIKARRDEYGFSTFNIGFTLRTLGAALGSELHVPEHGIDYITKHVLTNLDDLDAMEIPDPYHNPVLTPMLECAKVLKDAFPDMMITTNIVGPITSAISIRPVESVLKDTVKHPEKLHQLLDFIVAASVRWTEVFCHEFGKTSIIFNDPVTCTDLLSKRQFEKFSKPYIQKMVDEVEQKTGTRMGAHICGHTRGIWEDLVDIGLSSFSVDNCESLLEAKEIMGSKMKISGNVSPVEVLRDGSIDDVLAACRQCLIDGGDSPCGYTLGTGCQVPLGTPKCNLDAYIYAARTYGRGARKGHLPEGVKEFINS